MSKEIEQLCIYTKPLFIVPKQRNNKLEDVTPRWDAILVAMKARHTHYKEELTFE